MDRSSEISTSKVLSALCNAKSINLLSKIALAKEADWATLLKETALSNKALYTRLARFLKVGIAFKGTNHKYSLTSFGKVVCHAQHLIVSASKNYWRLSALESLNTLGELPATEYTKMCERLLNDQVIKDALLLQNTGKIEQCNSSVCVNSIITRKPSSKNNGGAGKA
jgi:hypothetical protein